MPHYFRGYLVIVMLTKAHASSQLVSLIIFHFKDWKMNMLLRNFSAFLSHNHCIYFSVFGLVSVLTTIYCPHCIYELL